MVEYNESDEFYATEAQDDFAAATLASETCPLCGQDCGVADYDPPDPTVGIWGGCFTNECPVHGTFYTYDDGTQEWDNQSCPTCGGNGCGDCMDEDAGEER